MQSMVASSYVEGSAKLGTRFKTTSASFAS